MTQVTLNLPTSAYDQFALQAKGRAGKDGRPLTVSQIIEKMVIDRQ
jgi:hypothetical protein